MKVTIERQDLLRSLTHVQSVVERRNTIPILSNLLIKAEESGVRMSATDLDIEVVETSPAQVDQTGGTTAPAHMLYDIVRKLPEGAQLEITQGSDENRLEIVSGQSRFSLATLPAEDFPDLAGGEWSHSFRLGAKDLKELIEKTRFAISTEETRYYLNGIYLHAPEAEQGHVLRAVATDGHRLAQVQMAAPEGANGMPGVIVPRKTVQELSKLTEETDAEIDVSLSASKIQFTIDKMVLTSKLIDGTFPDYQRVIPKDNDKALGVDTKLFSRAVDRVSTINAEKGRAIKLSLGKDKIVLTVNNPDSGSAEEEVAATYSSDPVEIGFNSSYLLDIAGQFDGSPATFMLADADSPAIVRDGDDETALYVLMPMRV